MFRVLMLILLLMIRVAAYSDNDFDGVEDSKDRCPGSSMEDIVDASGCVPVNVLMLSAGHNISTGNYGSTQTTVTNNTMLVLDYRVTDYFFSASTSYYASGSYDPTVTGSTSTSGMGDTYTSFGYTQTWGKRSQLTLNYSANVKWATADEGVGTGHNDYTLSVSGSYAMDRWLLLMQYGFTVTGDSETVSYKDVSSYTLGSGYTLSSQWFVTLSYSYVDAYVSDTQAMEVMNLFASYWQSKKVGYTLFYGYGLSESAADHSMSFMFNYRFN